MGAYPGWEGASLPNAPEGAGSIPVGIVPRFFQKGTRIAWRGDGRPSWRTSPDATACTRAGLREGSADAASEMGLTCLLNPERYLKLLIFRRLEVTTALLAQSGFVRFHPWCLGFGSWGSCALYRSLGRGWRSRLRFPASKTG